MKLRVAQCKDTLTDMRCDNVREEVNVAEKQRAEISAELLDELRRRAKEQGRSEGELLDEAVKRYLEIPSSLAELFEEADRWQKERGIEALSDEEALALADEELHVMRRERRDEWRT